MSIGYYLNKVPYSILWFLVNFFKKELPTVFYCHDMIDWYAFQPVYKHLSSIEIVSDKKNVANRLNEMGIKVKRFPCFPKVVIMCRNYIYKFPHQNITKIGLRNSPYHFKSMTDIDAYNKFAVYLFTSKADLQSAEKAGIRTGKSVGYPKLDPAFDGTYNDEYIDKLKQKLSLDPQKTTILLTATWYRSDMSAVFFWHKHLKKLISYYNVLVSVHPWMDNKFIKQIRLVDDVKFLEDENIIPYIMLADICISDTSAAIAEFCAMDKPIITFKVMKSPRTLPAVEKIIEKISYRINSFEQLILSIEYAVKNKKERSKERSSANSIFFDKLDGKASLRAAAEINKLLNNR